MPVETFYKRDTVITAMCIWEELIGNIEAPEWKEFWETRGTAEMRDAALKLAPYCIAHYEQVDFDEPFDWEFVPMWLRLCVDWEPSSSGPTAKVKSLDAAVQALGEAIHERLMDRSSWEPDDYGYDYAQGGTV